MQLRAVLYDSDNFVSHPTVPLRAAPGSMEMTWDVRSGSIGPLQPLLDGPSSAFGAAPAGEMGPYRFLARTIAFSLRMCVRAVNPGPLGTACHHHQLAVLFDFSTRGAIQQTLAIDRAGLCEGEMHETPPPLAPIGDFASESESESELGERSRLLREPHTLKPLPADGGSVSAARRWIGADLSVDWLLTLSALVLLVLQCRALWRQCRLLSRVREWSHRVERGEAGGLLLQVLGRQRGGGRIARRRRTRRNTGK